jgi:hypothetical protein
MPSVSTITSAEAENRETLAKAAAFASLSSEIVFYSRADEGLEKHYCPKE